MNIAIISLGGTPTTYGNCEGSSSKYGNFNVEFLAQFLRDHCKHNIKIIYYNENEMFTSEFLNISLQNDFYGIYVDISHFNEAITISKYLKSKNKTVFAIGRIISEEYLWMIKESFAFDYYILGDPEEPVLRLLNYVEESTLIDDENIATKTSFQFKKKNVGCYIDRYPAFDYYFDGKSNWEKVHCLSTRNDVCSGSCSFCWTSKGAPQFKSVEHIISEIDTVSSKYDVRNFYITDNNIFDFGNYGNKKRLIELFQGIKALNRNLTFTALANAKSLKESDMDLYQLMKEAGLYSFLVGIDAGNEQDLKLYNKQTTLEENFAALTLLNRCNIWARFGFIFYNPYSTKLTVRKNFEFLCAVKSANYYHYGALCLLVFEGTELKKKMEQDNLLSCNYHGVNIFDYTFKEPEIEKWQRFIKYELTPLIEERISIQYLKIKKAYEMAKSINSGALKYKEFVSQIEERSFQLYKEYFSHLYIDYNLDYCISHKGDFVQKMEEISCENAKVLTELEEILFSTPIRK